MLRVQDSILALPKATAKTLETLCAADITSIEDLLLICPKKYLDKRDIINFSSIIDKGDVNTFVRVLSMQFTSLRAPKIVVEDIADNSDVFPKYKRANILAFGRDYLKKTIKVGNVYHIYAQATRKPEYGNSLQISKFDIKPALEANGHYVSDNYGELRPSFFLSIPSLDKKIISESEKLFDNLDWNDESLASINEFLYSHNLPSLKKALYLKLHPSNFDDIEASRRSFAAYEVLKNFPKGGVEAYSPILLNDSEKTFISSLPFELTGSQLNAIVEIISSLELNVPTQRLLQGEVGSGKTIVCFIAAYHQILKGEQVVLMAPTEILSYQHYINAKKFFKKTNVRISYLSSSIKRTERDKILSSLKAGDIDLLIGTHSILGSEIEFKALSLAIVDEEQRFGALQKENISLKGKCVHIIFATATPIPRSIMKIFSNRISCSTLERITKDRFPVKTFIVPPSRRIEAYRTIIPEFKKGNCAYFIVPRIDADDEAEKKDISTLESELLGIFGDIPHAVIHSRIKQEEREDIFAKFMSGDILYLVSTSVVEVGIDNKNATVMFIEDADMFGLSTLHQLRGRVGRGDKQSWCFLSYREGITDSGKKRLRTLKETSDGFVLAEKDMQLRGSGDIFGLKQSGKSLFNYFDIEKDSDLVD